MMMKKLLLFPISLLLAPAAQALQFEVNDITYTWGNLESSLIVTSNQNQSLSGDIVIPSCINYEGTTYTVKAVDYEAFLGCIHITSLTLSEGVTSIGDYAFEGCLALVSVVLPEGLTSIGGCAFQWCSSLCSVILPSTVTSIGDYAFSNCRALRKFICNSVVPLPVNEECFKNADPFLCILFVPNTAKPAYMSAQVWGSFLNILEEGIVTEYDVTLKEPGDLRTVIGWDYYDDVYKLSVSGPVNGEDVYTFRNKFPALRILDLRNATIVTGGGVYFGTDTTADNQIGNFMFHKMCLQSLILPENITSIGEQAFSGCMELTSMIIPEGVISIGERAFEGCRKLAAIHLSSTVTTIAKNAFNLCDALCQYVVAANQETFSAMDGVLFSKNLDTLVAYPRAGSSEYYIPDGVKVIGDYAFASCRYISSVILPESVTSIGDYAFACCAKLSVLTIPEGVLTIGTGAFQYSGLSTVSIPSTVISIGMYAFAGCSSLTTINALNATPPEIGVDGFCSVNKSSCTIYVPAGSITAYEAANKWKDFEEILEIAMTESVTTTDTPLVLYTESGAVVLKGVVAGSTVTVYNLQGTEMQKLYSDGGEQRIELPTGAIYFVKAGEQVAKVAL